WVWCGEALSDRGVGLAGGTRPVQAVLLARAADDALRVDRQTIGLGRQVGVLVLRIVESKADLNGGKLVAADTPRQNFFTPRRRVELPGIAFLDQRYREREVILPDHQCRRLAGLGCNAMLCGIG